MARPFGRVTRSNCSPTGSASRATASTSRAIAGDAVGRQPQAIDLDSRPTRSRSPARSRRESRSRAHESRSQSPRAPRFFTSVDACASTIDARLCAAAFSISSSVVTGISNPKSPIANPWRYSITTLFRWITSSPKLIPENRRNLRRTASLDALEIGGAVVRDAASDRLAFGTDDVHAVAAIERTLHVDDAGGQQRAARAPAPSPRRHRCAPPPSRRAPRESIACGFPFACDSTGNRVPTASPLTDLTRTLSVVPPATSTVTPDSVASRAACSFVVIPPVPAHGARARRQREDLVGDDRHFANQRRRRVPPRIGGEQPLLIGQQNQQIGVDQVRHQRRQIVVVADLDFLGRHDVVLVDDRHDLPLEQREQRVARVQVALAVGQVSRASAASARRSDLPWQTARPTSASAWSGRPRPAPA